MNVHQQRGFSLIEVLVSLAILMAVAAPVLYVTAGAQRLARSQSEATDLTQRARATAEKLLRDIAMAGAGPAVGLESGSLGEFLPGIVPARTGARSADAELTASAERLSIVYVADDGWSARLVSDMADAGASVPVDASAPGCPPAGLCGFVAGARALLLDTAYAGAGYDAFNVADAAGELAHDTPFSRAYSASTAAVVPIVQRVYYFDRERRRLMLYDGHQSDVPFVDNVVDLRFEYFVHEPGVVGLRRIPLPELSDGPAIGLPPNRFDADLLKIRMVRVKLRLQAASDDVRGTGAWFARPGRSTSAYSLVPDIEVTFDVALRNPPADR